MKRDAIDFENGNVSFLFRKLLIPTLLGTLALSAVTAIDGIFVGHGVGANGVAAVNIVVPMYQIMAGLGLMIGAGCSVVSSIHLAQQKKDIARINITQAIVFTSLLVFLMTLAVMAFPTQFAYLLGSSDTLLPQVTDYLKWIMPSFLFQMWSMIGLFIIRLDGSPKYAMWCNIIPATLNAILDWLFIFPLNMGVKGAAIATSISIIVGGLMALSYLLFFAKDLSLVHLKISRKSMMLALRNIGYQCKIGSSTMLGEMTLAVLIYVGNLVFMQYLGDNGVAAFGIACYYTPFFFSVGNAIAQSAQPIISYNYGIDRWKHIRKSRNLLLGTAIVCGSIVTLLFVFTPDILVGLFVDTTSTAGELAVKGFPLYAVGVIFFILNVAVTGYYQSVERIGISTIYVFLRGFALLIPCFVLLPKFMGTNGIWSAMPTAEIIALLLMGLILYCSRKRSK